MKYGLPIFVTAACMFIFGAAQVPDKPSANGSSTTRPGLSICYYVDPGCPDACDAAYRSCEAARRGGCNETAISCRKKCERRGSPGENCG